MGYDVMDAAKAKKADVADYDVIVLGGGIYAMGIAGLDFLRRNPELSAQKKMFVFCDGASPICQEAVDAVRERNMKDGLANVPLFYFRGGWDMQHMSFMDRSLCKMLRKAVAKKDPAQYEPWEQALMEAGETQCDWTDETYIQPLLDALRAL